MPRNRSEKLTPLSQIARDAIAAIRKADAVDRDNAMRYLQVRLSQGYVCTDVEASAWLPFWEALPRAILDPLVQTPYPERSTIYGLLST